MPHTSPDGFAAFGGATAEIVRLCLGSDKTDIAITSSSANPGTGSTRPYLRYFSYSRAARDNSISMIFSGWDFRKSVLDGEETGRQIAGYVFENSFRKND